MLGAGGAGLSGAARLLAEAGHDVSGHDREASPFTASLAALGVDVKLGASEAAHMPAEVELVARSAAVSDDDPQVRAARERGVEVIKYAELLGRLSPPDKTLAIAGTHGKTTTTWMIYEALEAAGGPAPGTLVGGLHQARGVNSISPDPTGWFAVEACEYDRSFLQLQPFGAIVTNFEEDHLDCYGSLEELERGFCRFVDRVSAEGLVVLGTDVPEAIAEAARGRVWRLGKEIQLDLLGQDRGYFRFLVRGPGWTTPEVQLSIPGRFNVEDAALAIALAVGCAGVSPAAAARGVAEFPGAVRRFESWGESGGIPVVHDYAHHPTEVRVTLEARVAQVTGRPAQLREGRSAPHHQTRVLGGVSRCDAGRGQLFVEGLLGAQVARAEDPVEPLGGDDRALEARVVDHDVGPPAEDAHGDPSLAGGHDGLAKLLGVRRLQEPGHRPPHTERRTLPEISSRKRGAGPVHRGGPA